MKKNRFMFLHEILLLQQAAGANKVSDFILQAKEWQQQQQKANYK